MTKKYKVGLGRLQLVEFYKKYLVYGLFAIMVLISLLSFKGYGISWDEGAQHGIGMISYSYIFKHDNSLLTFGDRAYGVAFELPLIILEKALKLTDTRSVYLMRHLVTHIFFLFSAVFLFKLIDDIYKNKLLATVGFLMLVLNPMLYAHSFFNSKDIPFLSMFIICLYLNYRALTNKNYLNFVILGIAYGLLINLRIMGIIAPLFTTGYLLIDASKEKKYKSYFILWVVLFFTCLGSLYITWPFLWVSPWRNFLFAYRVMSQYPWNGTVLFSGSFIKASELPWYYVPVWFAITTPILFLVSGVCGTAMAISKPIWQHKSFFKNRSLYINLMFLGLFLGPIIIVIKLHSVLYDSWRQMLFIYPSFIMLAIFGLSMVRKKITRYIIGAIFCVTFVSLAVFMIKNYPNQQAYFNETLTLRGPEYIRHNFELDYWCPSAKQSLEYILKTDNSKSINVSFDGCPGPVSLAILPKKDRDRLHVVKMEQAKYFVTSYRGHPSDYNNIKDASVYKLKVLDNTINEVFKLR